MALSILFSICAVEKFVAYLKEENKKDKIKNIAISALYILLAVSSYQGTVGIFVIFSAIFILKYSKTFCKFVKNTILTDRVFCEKTLYVVFGREKLTLFLIFHGRNRRVIMLDILE